MIYVLYHKNCMDGFAAAWAFWKLFGNDAKYIPVQYGEPLPKIEDQSKVYIVDFSYSRDVLDELYFRSKQLVVLDHHKTAQAELEGLPYAKFNMTKSGAVLAWEYVFSEKPVPELLLYVQDRDLWQWKLPDSRKINAVLAVHSKEFEIFNSFIDKDKQLLIDEGHILLLSQESVVNSLADKCFFDETKFDQRIPMLNSATLQSKIGNELCQRHSDCAFAAIFFYLDLNTRVWSLRSIGNFDVSEVAKRFGGGGHKNAAGFKENV